MSNIASSTSLPATRSIELPGRAPLPLRVYGKKARGQVAPLVLHFHGGAFVSGDLDSGACFAQLLADAGAVVASLGYPLAPEHRFPDAVEAGHGALEWLFKQRSRLAGGGAPLFVAGEEAGGNLAAAVALVARDRAGPPLAGQILVAPMLDPCSGTASLREALGPQTCCKWADGWKQYLRGPMDAEHPYAVPARAQRLGGVPPTLVLTSLDDPMRDEALAYVGRLRAAGVRVDSELLPSATGWPESLGDPSTQPCACAEPVKQQLRRFFLAAAPPAS
jgi:acetyl esterase/lipase